MTLRALLFATCIVAFFTTLQAATVTLSPGATTKLAAGNTYQATTDGTYTLTTNGTPVNATIKVSANVTLILDNCHIASTTNYPLWLSDSNKTLTILFKQSNQIIANSSASPFSPIYATASNSTLILAKAPGAQNATLFLRGSVTKDYANPPIYFTSSTSSVIMRSGDITIATSARTAGTTSLIPSLISTGTFKLHGGTLTAQMRPRFKASELADSDLIGSKLQNVEGVVSPLFNCTSFTMTSGLLTTAGDKVCPYGDNKLVATTQAYDTSYAYAQTHLNNLTSATTISQTGGSICGPTAATFYGFPPNTSIPSACFSTGKSVTSDENGKVRVNGVSPTLCYATPQSQAIAEVIGAPLIPTENGILAEAALGISDIQIDAETLAPILILALDIPRDTTSTEKTLPIQVLSDTTDTPSTVIFDQTITFTRASTSGHFTAKVSCPSTATLGSTRYLIRAYN
ncbi:MAG: hypothetical protein IKW38_05715 [Kiritimatiellae bacterium]|nr:hypothetical protein [Kiritimatiellia bacterium]